MWVVHRAGEEAVGTVELTRVAVTAIATTTCSSPVRRPATLVVTAGVQKMAPGLHVALPGAAATTGAARNEAGRAMKSFNLTEWALEHRAVVLFLMS